MRAALRHVSETQIMDYGLVWISVHVGVCMPVQLCVHAHVQYACLRARWLSSVHTVACEKEVEDEGVCS